MSMLWEVPEFGVVVVRGISWKTMGCSHCSRGHEEFFSQELSVLFHHYPTSVLLETGDSRGWNFHLRWISSSGVKGKKKKKKISKGKTLPWPSSRLSKIPEL